MRARLTSEAWLMMLLHLALAEPLRGEPEGAAASAERQRIAALIDQLGEPTFARREAAGRKLEALGEPALPLLRAAARESDDLEIRRRAEQAARRILLAACRSQSTGMELALIDPGTFLMGSPVQERDRRPDEAQHRVRITRAYLLGLHEVTQAEFERVMGFNPSWFSEKGEGQAKVASMETGRFPVERVTWFDSAEFCNRLSERDGLAPYYQVADAKREEGAIVAASIKPLGGSGYRLPTEAEWEYACRAGTFTAFHFGAGNSGKEANLKAYTGGGGYGAAPMLVELARTARIASYPANSWRLHDMHANAGEWCDDWYGQDYYAASPAADPSGPAAGVHKVLRGGSWLVSEATCRSASRFWLTPGDRNNYTGFRVCRSP